MKKLLDKIRSNPEAREAILDMIAYVENSHSFIEMISDDSKDYQEDVDEDCEDRHDPCPDVNAGSHFYWGAYHMAYLIEAMITGIDTEHEIDAIGGNW